MNFAKAFSFVFEDPDWAKKILIGGLITLIPVVGSLLVLGYMVSVGRNVIRGNPRPLPDWSDFGQMLIDGLYALIIYFVYTLPILIVLCVVLAPSLAIGSAFSEDGSLNAVASLGVILCCIGVLFSTFYSQCVIGHAYGQAYLLAKQRA